MDLNKLTAIASKLKEDSTKKGNTGEWPNVVFLPEGNHKGRFITDPEDELYTTYRSYGYFNKGIRDPDELPEDALPPHFYNHLKDLANSLSDEFMKWGRKSKNVFLIYFYLTETDSPDENWKPNNLYCLLCDWRFESAFSTMLNTLLSDAPEKLMKSLHPEEEGNLMSISYVRDKQKSTCSISPLFSSGKPLVTLTEEQKSLPDNERTALINELMGDYGYRPLSVSYIRPGFNQEKYDALVKAYESELTTLRAGKSAKDNKSKDNSEEVDNTSNTNSESTEDTVTESVNEPSTETEEVAVQDNSTSEPEPESKPVSANPFAKFKKN